MNKFLADGLSFVNGFIAFVIIFATVILFATNGGNLLAFIVGCLAGLVLAILICGTLALLINIKDELVLAKQSLNDLKK